MTGNQTTTPRPRRVGVGRQLSLFYTVAALALIAVSIGAVVASRSVARTEALKGAERTTARLADLLGPLLVGMEAGDPAARHELDLAVKYRMGGDYLTEITVWAADGRIVYSSEPDEIGQQDEPPSQVTDAITRGVTTSDFTVQPHATDEKFGPDDPGFVEVYVPFDQPELKAYAFESYYNYTPVNEVANSLLWQLIPLVLIPLIVLQLIQVPVTSSMARRIRRHEADRAAMLERTLSVSERERIQIAGDLHDGPVQELAGVGYALDSLASSVPEQHAILMRRIQDTVHQVIGSLRRLMVDLYPPDLSADQLAQTITGLAAPLRDQGVMVNITTMTPMPAMAHDTVTTLYRVAREALANVAKHANAAKADITLGFDNSDAAATPTVLLRITDNGVGVDPAKIDKKAEGHLGLRLLTDRVENLGGTLTVRPNPRGGTIVTAELPATETADPTVNDRHEQPRRQSALTRPG